MLFAHDYILWVLYMCVVCRCSCVHMWKSENSLWGMVLSFHCAGPRDWAQIIRLGGRCLYRVSCISGPVSFRIRLELWIFARNSTEATWPSHPIISRVHTITMWFMTWISITWLKWYLSNSSSVKLLFSWKDSCKVHASECSYTSPHVSAWVVLSLAIFPSYLLNTPFINLCIFTRMY